MPLKDYRCENCREYYDSIYLDHCPYCGKKFELSLDENINLSKPKLLHKQGTLSSIQRKE